MSDGKGSTKNNFELDRLNHDSHANRAERYFSGIYLLGEVYVIPIKY